MAKIVFTSTVDIAFFENVAKRKSNPQCFRERSQKDLEATREAVLLLCLLRKYNLQCCILSRAPGLVPRNIAL
jgi:hypothetical protein